MSIETIIPGGEDPIRNAIEAVAYHVSRQTDQIMMSIIADYLDCIPRKKEIVNNSAVERSGTRMVLLYAGVEIAHMIGPIHRSESMNDYGLRSTEKDSPGFYISVMFDVDLLYKESNEIEIISDMDYWNILTNYN